MRKKGNPILVTGSHRSGSTWIGQTISQHPTVRYVHEPFNVGYPNKLSGLRLNTWFAHAPSSNQKEEIIRSFNTLLQQNPIEHAFQTSKAAGMDLKTPLRFGRHLLSEFVFNPRILVKDPIAVMSAGWLHEKYHFKVICMIRNPLAFIGSLKVAGWDFDFDNFRRQDELMTGKLSRFSDEIESMCMEGNAHDFIDRAILLWNILHFVILEYQKQYPQWLFVKHEDISARPDLGFQEIFEFLGLKLIPHLKNYIGKYTSRKNAVEAESASYQPRNSKLLLQTWKNRLSSVEISRVRASTGDLASCFYEDFV